MPPRGGGPPADPTGRAGAAPRTGAVATVVIGTWTREFDAERARGVLAGEDPFNEDTPLDDHGPAAEPPGSRKDPLTAPGGAPA
ncbi:hypothetical protein BKA00_004192 [Actinomadura coerulea]|uniref:Uncharacterized protein n=1 Tax=Actinomadura coerulea TaxID=46159 RepID=A0A7X0L090_9ACTN|nr:hypothetical protein [Actinomadura coerulea]MBB6397278.1 hypothetical protein [Actinomadura coerulea]GGQ46356.1 hypothetical protein GCM10010187_75720 [Actinomadura coerulea]